MSLKIDGVLEKIKRYEYETDEVFQIRVLFITLLEPKTDTSFKEAEMLSNIWISMLFLKCKFPKEIEDRVDKILKKKSKLLELRNEILQASV